MQSPQTKQQTSQTTGYSTVGNIEGTEVLADLGLTGAQARVYLALLKTGNARARDIAELAQVNRQEVYHILEELQQLGLTQQNVTQPTTYSATPITEGIKHLLEQKTNELANISQRAAQLTKKLETNQAAAITLKPCFGVICEADRGNKHQKAIQQTQISIEAITSWTRFKQLCFHFETDIKNALKKGLSIRIVTERPPSHHLPKWVKAALAKYPNFEVKTMPSLPTLVVTIFDHSVAAIAFNPNSRLTKGPELWTSHPALTAAYQTYFNTAWTQTKRLQP